MQAGRAKLEAERALQDALNDVLAGNVDALAARTGLDSIPRLQLHNMTHDESTVSMGDTAATTTTSQADVASSPRGGGGGPGSHIGASPKSVLSQKSSIAGTSWVSEEFRRTVSVARRDKASARGAEVALASARVNSMTRRSALITGGSAMSVMATGRHHLTMTGGKGGGDLQPLPPSVPQGEDGTGGVGFAGGRRHFPLLFEFELYKFQNLNVIAAHVVFVFVPLCSRSTYCFLCASVLHFVDTTLLWSCPRCMDHIMGHSDPL